MIQSSAVVNSSLSLSLSKLIVFGFRDGWVLPGLKYSTSLYIKIALLRVQQGSRVQVKKIKYMSMCVCVSVSTHMNICDPLDRNNYRGGKGHRELQLN